MGTSNIDQSQGEAAVTASNIDDRSPRKPWRLWPGVAAALLELLAWFVFPAVSPDLTLYGILGGIIGGLIILLWWLFFSRALWSERLGAILLMVVGMFVTSRFVDKSIANAGMGRMLPILSIPVMSLALVCGVVGARRLSSLARRVSIAAAILLGCSVFTVVRTGGISGSGNSDFHWRWSKTPEERLLAQAAQAGEAADEPAALPGSPAARAAEEDHKAPPADVAQTPGPSPSLAATAEKTPVSAGSTARAAWPGFRGPGRDSVIRGLQISTDWDHSPPVLLWRRPIGPGWSSFAVSGDLCYTQEQRGNDELVACYNRTTGEPVWRHRDPVRFWESNGGAGPRATPTLSGGRVYAFGATGILNALDAASGAALWARNVAADSDTKVPGWGFTSSPLVAGDVVIVAASGKLVGYDRATGKLRWSGPTHGGSYSSPHRVTIDGVQQILLLNGDGATSVAPSDGTLLWEHPWDGFTIIQPAMTADGDVLISTASATGGIGTRRLAVAHGPAGWTAKERWTSNGLKPYFNDFVVHKGHAYGFDGSILACIDLRDGQRKWKGGRYGSGQLVLLADQDLLLVISEEGELVLVGAAPDGFKEITRFKAIEGKTWNHPVLVGDVLLVRNGEEMAAFKLPTASH